MHIELGPAGDRAARAFRDASYWHLAAKILYGYAQTFGTVAAIPGVPAVEPDSARHLFAVAGPVDAFALELYFKADLWSGTAAPKRVHTLVELFRSLDPTLQTAITSRYDSWASANPGWAKFWAADQQSTTFDEVLHVSSDAFYRFRYMAEHSTTALPATSFKYLAMPIADATRDALLQRHASWSSLAAPHTTMVTNTFRSARL